MIDRLGDRRGGRFRSGGAFELGAGDVSWNEQEEPSRGQDLCWSRSDLFALQLDMCANLHDLIRRQ